MNTATVALIALLSAAQAATVVSPQSSVAPATYLSEAELLATLKEAAKAAPAMHTATVVSFACFDRS